MFLGSGLFAVSKCKEGRELADEVDPELAVIRDQADFVDQAPQN